jgi:hypothetical protein
MEPATTAMETHPHEHWKPRRSMRDCLPVIVTVLVAALSASAGQWAHGTRDDLSPLMSIQVPAHLTQEQRVLWEQLATKSTFSQRKTL